MDLASNHETQNEHMSDSTYPSGERSQLRECRHTGFAPCQKGSQKRPHRPVDSESVLLNAGDATDRHDADTSGRHPHTPQSWARITALISVPVFWGSFTPSMKLLFTFANPPPALLTILASHVIGSAALCLLWFAESPTGQFDSAGGRRRAMRASCELGTYLFFGQLTQLLGAIGVHANGRVGWQRGMAAVVVVLLGVCVHLNSLRPIHSPPSGLENTTASINAILVQAAVVIVPLLEAVPPTKGSGTAALLGRLMPSALALGGVVLLTVAPGEGQKQDDPTMGILFSLSSAGAARAPPRLPRPPPPVTRLRPAQRATRCTRSG